MLLSRSTETAPLLSGVHSFLGVNGGVTFKKQQHCCSVRLFQSIWKTSLGTSYDHASLTTIWWPSKMPVTSKRTEPFHGLTVCQISLMYYSKIISASKSWGRGEPDLF